MTVFRKTNRSARKSIIAYARKYAFVHKDANVNKEKERVLLPSIDEASDWLQIWTAASSLDVKGNKAIKKRFVFLANLCWFSQIRSQYDRSYYVPKKIMILIITPRNSWSLKWQRSIIAKYQLQVIRQSPTKAILPQMIVPKTCQLYLHYLLLSTLLFKHFFTKFFHKC